MHGSTASKNHRSRPSVFRPSSDTLLLRPHARRNVTTPTDRSARLRAALVHFGFSALIAAAAAALVFGLWYPGPYARLAGGVGLFVLISGVDVVMGPLITLVIFDRRKPARELRRDMAIVVLLQLAALGYGLFIMFNARPVALALEGERFRLVRAVDVALDELPKAPAALRQLPLTGPVTIRTESPTDPDQQFDAIQRALAGADLGTRPQFWRPWDATGRQEALAAAKPLAPLQQRAAQARPELDAAIARSGLPAEQLRYLPLITPYGDWVVLLNAASGELAGFAALDGF